MDDAAASSLLEIVPSQRGQKHGRGASSNDDGAGEARGAPRRIGIDPGAPSARQLIDFFSIAPDDNDDDLRLVPGERGATTGASTADQEPDTTLRLGLGEDDSRKAHNKSIGTWMGVGLDALADDRLPPESREDAVGFTDVATGPFHGLDLNQLDASPADHATATSSGLDLNQLDASPADHATTTSSGLDLNQPDASPADHATTISSGLDLNQPDASPADHATTISSGLDLNRAGPEPATPRRQTMQPLRSSSRLDLNQPENFTDFGKE
ncbi:uncharacterized protein LOC133923200 [Phragmites australis]|uniref:uncharacterized protein LOC133923200 n=1 Tax=Phragmites australis TaxID=29695 RepID=UPI002D78A8E8|nr:uncharacterized protein LOC133923200 [Phragmites australis]